MSRVHFHQSLIALELVGNHCVNDVTLLDNVNRIFFSQPSKTMIIGYMAHSYSLFASNYIRKLISFIGSVCTMQ